jgi:hypothetical protein
MFSPIITSHPPLVVVSNWRGERCVAKASQNCRHKTWLMNQYNVYVITMWQIPREGFVKVKRQVAPRTCAIWCGMWPCVIWKQSWNNYGNPFVESFSWKYIWRCSNTIQKWPLVDKCDMHWNVNLKELEKNSRSWFGS